MKKLLNVEPVWCSELILTNARVACPLLDSVSGVEARIHIAWCEAHLVRLHVFHVLGQRLQDRVGLLGKADLLLLLCDAHLEVLSRVLDFLFELQQLLESVVEKDDLSRGLVS